MLQAKVSAPFQLRHVWVQDRDWNTVMSERTAIFVDSSALKTYDFASRANRVAVPITEEMRVGRRPAAMLNRTRIEVHSHTIRFPVYDSKVFLQAAQATVVLVHGYCAGVNEFPLSQFTNAAQFKDYKQARSNDAFALKIKEFGDQFPAFTIVSFNRNNSALYFKLQLTCLEN